MTQPPTNPPTDLPSPMRLHIDPPIDQWQVTPRNGRTTPVIATGHQPVFWHPGILAKFIAMQAFARSIQGESHWLSVDHNVLPPLSIDVPIRNGDALSIRHLVIDTRGQAAALPPNRLAPLSRQALAKGFSQACEAEDLTESGYQGLRQLASRGYSPLSEERSEHLADQTVAAMMDQEIVPREVGTLSTSRLVTDRFVERLLADPVGCVRCYNRAALTYPEAGIRPLYVGRDVVEVPLWAQGDGACTPVFVDLGDSKRPQLFTQGQSLDLTGRDALRYLRPRAASLSAIMRSEHCDLFIHGTGGGVYDWVTDRWWTDWTHETLAPMVVVSADVYLPFDVPVATRDELQRAVWFDHHLPFNVDRHTDASDDAEAALRADKRQLLDHMQDDRDKRRRAKAFNRIHAINIEFRNLHKVRLDQARQHAQDARVGVRNARIAARRDWCFALYPDAVLGGLSSQIRRPLPDPYN